MLKYSLLLLAGLGLATALVMAPVRAEDKKAEVIKTESKDAVVARTIDFPTVLEVDLPSLISLGGRIDQAREQAEPVTLALAARELEAAEKVAGKHATLTAADLEKEAVEMASRRARVAEIKMAKSLLTGAESQKKLTEALTKATESTRGIAGSTHVINTSGRSVAIYINDNYVGYVPNNGERDFYVGDNPWDTTKLFARSGNKTWGPLYKPQATQNHNWNLFP